MYYVVYDSTAGIEIRFHFLVAGKSFVVQLLGKARRNCLPMSTTWDCLGLGADLLRKQADLSNDKEHSQAEIVPNLETMQAWLACCLCCHITTFCRKNSGMVPL